MKFFHSLASRFIIILTLLISHINSNESKNTSLIRRGIHKRAFFYPALLYVYTIKVLDICLFFPSRYPYNACSGILVAIAIPLNLPGRNVFLSYNFEVCLLKLMRCFEILLTPTIVCRQITTCPINPQMIFQEFCKDSQDLFRQTMLPTQMLTVHLMMF